MTWSSNRDLHRWDNAASARNFDPASLLGITIRIALGVTETEAPSKGPSGA
jgi:hypothetical protein